MKKFIWRIEYSLTLMAIFIGILFMIPTSFCSKTAINISKWNAEYNQMQYMFSAMSAQEADIKEKFKSANNPDKRELYLIELIKPYMRLKEPLKKKYIQHYMNGKTVQASDLYHFKTLYLNNDDLIVGIKYVMGELQDPVVFIMIIDTNGYKKPNTWGRDIFGIKIYKDGNINSFGYGWDVDKLRKDCSKNGTGLSCSHFYRIGGEFIE